MPICSKCGNDTPLERMSFDSRKQVHRSYCKNCSSESNREWRRKNKDRQRELERAYHLRTKAKRNARSISWDLENPHRASERRSQRRAAKLKRVPSWADRAKIAEIYAERKRIELETGLPHHADHMVPLQGKYVSGFHVENNLEILTDEANLRKGVAYWPDMPDYGPEDYKELDAIREALYNKGLWPTKIKHGKNVTKIKHGK